MTDAEILEIINAAKLDMKKEYEALIEALRTENTRLYKIIDSYEFADIKTVTSEG